MAFKKLTSGNIISIKKGTTIEGFLTKHRIIPAKKKGDRDSIVYTVKSKDGTEIDFWGNGFVNHQFLAGNGKQLNPQYKGYLVRLVGQNKVKLKPGQAPAQAVEILVDQDKKLK